MTKRHVILAVIALMMAVGCKTYESIHPGAIEEGDFVRIVTWEGEVLSFEVIDVRQDTVIGAYDEVAFTDIKSASVGASPDWGTRYEPTTARFVFTGLVVVAMFVVLGLAFSL